MKGLIFLIGLIITFCFSQKTPVAKKIPSQQSIVVEGVNKTWTDDYHYFANQESELEYIKQYIQEENEYSNLLQNDILTDELVEELNELMSHEEAEVSTLIKVGNYEYFSTKTEEQKFKVWKRKQEGEEESKAIEILDENNLYESLGSPKFFKLAKIVPQESGKFIAYSYDILGNEKFTVKFRNLDTMEDLDEKIEDAFYDFVWSKKDSENYFLYTKIEDYPVQPMSVWAHELEGAKEDELMFRTTDGSNELLVTKTSDSKFILISLDSHLGNSVYYLPANFDLSTKPELMFGSEGVYRYFVDHNSEDSLFYVQFSDANAPNFKVGRFNISNPSNIEIIQEGNAEIFIESIKVYKDFLVVLQYNTTECLQEIIRYELATLESYKLPIDEKLRYDGEIYAIEMVEMYSQFESVIVGDDYHYDENSFEFEYSSLITPKITYQYGLTNKTIKTIHEDQYTGYDRTLYKDHLFFALANDSVTTIPIVVAHKKDIELPTFTLLLSYSSYGIISKPKFDVNNVLLFNRNYISAVANLRGSSMKGMQYYYDGKLLNKKHTFEDLISCAEFLIEKKITTPKKLGIIGRSAGGLTVTATALQRPDLFEVVIAQVPFVDVINTMVNEELAFTVKEYNEWGNPKKLKYFEYMKSYDPYNNIKEIEYPNMFLEGGRDDQRVNFWEPLKLTAKLRATKKGENKISLNIYEGGHHGGVSDDKIKQAARRLSFLVKTLNSTIERDPLEFLWILLAILGLGGMMFLFMSFFICFECVAKKKKENNKEQYEQIESVEEPTYVQPIEQKVEIEKKE